MSFLSVPRHHLVWFPLSPKSAVVFSHPSWPSSQHVSPFKGHGRLWQFSDFVRGWPRVMIYQAPFINSSNKLWSWIMLYADRPLLDQCWPLRTPWLANSANILKLPTCFTSVNWVTLMSLDCFFFFLWRGLLKFLQRTTGNSATKVCWATDW